MFGALVAGTLMGVLSGCLQVHAAQDSSPSLQLHDPVGEQKMAELREWWESKTSEERTELLSRYAHFKGLQKDQIETLQRRGLVLDEERWRARMDLDPKQRKRFEDMTEAEQRKWLTRRAETRLRRRSAALEKRFPEEYAALQELPMEERMQAAEELMERAYREKMQERIQRAVDDGWIQPEMGTWLAEAPMYEVNEIMGQVGKWNRWKKMREAGEVDRWQLSEREQVLLFGQPPRQFFHSMRLLRQGVAKEEIFLNLSDQMLWDHPAWSSDRAPGRNTPRGREIHLRSGRREEGADPRRRPHSRNSDRSDRDPSPRSRNDGKQDG